jgi:hypothetical protein
MKLHNVFVLFGKVPVDVLFSGFAEPGKDPETGKALEKRIEKF